MKTVKHLSDSRGHANYGWLDTYHTFNFADYYNPDRACFGALRVLNDDTVAPGKGFDRHPHKDMEIISIPLEGALEHRDSEGYSGVIRAGDMQVMSAGSGIFHSEYNHSADREVRFLQIWVFPNKNGVKPRYDQITLDKEKMKNQWLQIASPNPEDEGVWIYQNAWFFLGEFDRKTATRYTMRSAENGLYIFVLEGSASVAGESLSRRDGLGIWDANTVELDMSPLSKVLLIEVPL